MNKIIIFMLFLLFPHTLLQANNIYFLNKEWKEIQSPHFVLVYPKKFQKYTHSIIRTAEKIHSSLYQLFPLISKKKTYIILTDHTDMANGMATTLPLKKIILYRKYCAPGHKNWHEGTFKYDISLHKTIFEIFF